MSSGQKVVVIGRCRNIYPKTGTLLFREMLLGYWKTRIFSNIKFDETYHIVGLLFTSPIIVLHGVLWSLPRFVVDKHN